MTVSFDSSKGKPGRAVKSVEVWTDDPENEMFVLMLVGNVTPPEGSREDTESADEEVR